GLGWDRPGAARAQRWDRTLARATDVPGICGVPLAADVAADIRLDREDPGGSPGARADCPRLAACTNPAASVRYGRTATLTAGLAETPAARDPAGRGVIPIYGGGFVGFARRVAVHSGAAVGRNRRRERFGQEHPRRPHCRTVGPQHRPHLNRRRAAR